MVHYRIDGVDLVASKCLNVRVMNTKVFGVMCTWT
jgi:hypothetical protein